ncbi:MAG: ParB/RepB/Spo0J family partition protein [Bacillota bacterium]|nr:ParB/RepB/Spo0J family partition protein [Candidatus Fermentithermobacillaceae bacterium]
MAKKGLGRGIEALIPVDPQPQDTPIVELDPAEIKADPLQPRQVFDEAKIEELAASLKEHGVIQPLIVRQVGGTYRLVAGERRLRAAMKAGIQKVPAVVRIMDDREAMEVSLVENLQREELGPLEQAGAFQRLMDEFGLTQEEVASRVGKSRPEVANTVRLLRLEPEVKKLISDGKLTGGHGRALLGLSGAAQVKAARSVLSRGLSVRKTEELVSGRLARRPKKSGPALPVRRRDAEDILSRALGTPVEVKVQGAKGSINIAFFGEEDLERIVEMIERGSKT